jgi:Fe2+ or Zn2+ uptake regulation protein
MGVLKILAAAARPMDVPTILGKLPDQADAVTVYRTLNTFTRKHLVHRVRGEDRSWRYAAGRPEGAPAHQHPHFICDDCGKVECLAGAIIPGGLVRQLSVARGYVVSYPEVLLHGRCPRCQ